MENWTDRAVAIMHKHKITQIQIARHLGVTNDYISLILLEKKCPKDAEHRIMTAIDEIIAERNKTA